MEHIKRSSSSLGSVICLYTSKNTCSTIAGGNCHEIFNSALCSPGAVLVIGATVSWLFLYFSAVTKEGV